MKNKWLTVLPAIMLLIILAPLGLSSQSLILSDTGDFSEGSFENTTIENDDNLTLGFSNSTDWELPADPDMILYFKMNNDASVGENDTLVYDYSNAGNNGTIIGATWTNGGKFGKCLEFGSSADFIETFPNSDFDSAVNLTVEFWVKFSNIYPVNYLAAIWYNLTERIDFTFADGMGFAITNNISNNGSLFLALTNDVSEGLWHHIVLEIEDNGSIEVPENERAIWRLYLDGLLVNSTYMYHSISDMADYWNVTIGSQSSLYLDGLLDQFIIYDQILNGAEIQANYERGRKYFPTGEYVSKVFSQAAPGSWDNISWVEEVPSGTGIEVSTRTSDDSSSWTVWEDQVTPSDLINDSSQYMQFRINFTTSDYDVTPKILSLSLNYTESDVSSPEILSIEFKPRVTFTNGDVNITVTTTDDSGIDRAWANITLPDSTSEIVDLVNNGTFTYNTSGKKDGVFLINISVNDTAGNLVYQTDTFHAYNSTLFSVNVTNQTDGITSTIKALYPGTTEEVLTFSAVDGIYTDRSIPDYVYDLLFSAFDDKIQLTLEDIDISVNQDRFVTLETFNGSIIFYFESNYTASDAWVRLSYDGTSMNKSRLRVFSCENWLFSSDSCAGVPNSTTSAVQNNVSNYFDVMGVGSLVSGGVAFMIIESWCGDGVCTKDFEDNSNCNTDCVCDDGETRPCSDNHLGVCSAGVETCVLGVWTGCLDARTTEICNKMDDDCDGIVDDVNNGNSVESTQCRCFNGAPADSGEICNGIDDDCDGEIDEDGDCCVNGETRDCGVSTDVGICEFGTSTCVNNVWGGCIGAVTPKQTEICFNNEDDDCDGETDEGCDHCTKGVKDEDEGGIDCGGDSCDPCALFPYWILIVLGAAIAVILFLLMKMFKKEGKELTWEELRKKYTPAEPQY